MSQLPAQWCGAFLGVSVPSQGFWCSWHRATSSRSTQGGTELCSSWWRPTRDGATSVGMGSAVPQPLLNPGQGDAELSWEHWPQPSGTPGRGGLTQHPWGEALWPGSSHRARAADGDQDAGSPRAGHKAAPLHLREWGSQQLGLHLEGPRVSRQHLRWGARLRGGCWKRKRKCFSQRNWATHRLQGWWKA